MNSNRAFLLFPVLFLLVLLAACGAAEDAIVADTRAPATASLTDGSPSDSQAAAPAPPIVGVTAAPATAAALPGPTPQGLIGPPFPENVNPLTGETVDDPAVLNRRPIAVKISNYPPVVRPQSGVNNADLVFEHYAEGGVTRFTAIFYGKDASPVGSIRSGRFIDLELPSMYDAGFAYSGSSGPVRLLIRDSLFFDRVISPDFGHGGFYRIEDPNKAFEHTLFTDTPQLHAILRERGLDTRPQFATNMVFSGEPPAGGTPATGIEVGYIGTNVYWSYDPASNRYLRSTDGQPHLDANTGEQLSFRNVVVVGAHHQDTDILEDQVAGGHYSIEIQIWIEGPVSIFRDGQRFEGRWRRQLENDMLTFYDLEGNLLPLGVGNSFVQVVPLGFTDLVVTQ